MPLLLIFLAVPLIEIFLFATVGSLIGPWYTVGLVIVTAFIGVTMLRQQGLATLNRARQRMNQGELPESELLDGLMLAIGGAFLLTPGFFTDTLGFCLLLPLTRSFVRSLILGMIKHRVYTRSAQFGHSPIDDIHLDVNTHHEKPARRGDTIEGEFRRD